MKYVIPTSEVAHKWAHQHQDNARNSGGNFYFKGKIIYSYGSHFPIAALHNNKVIMTTRTYSNTTAKHIILVEDAVSYKDKIYCYDPYKATHGTHSDNINQFEVTAKSISNKLPKSKKPEIYLSEIAHQKALLMAYVEHFELKPKAYKHLHYINIVTKDGAIIATEKERKATLASQKAIAKAREKQRVIDLAKDEEKLALWRKFKIQAYNGTLHLYSLEGTYLRFIKESNEIQTTKGIKLPIKVAERFYKWLKHQLQKGGCNGECNHEILGYQVDYVNTEGIKVGCHDVSWTEINTLAKKLKWC